MPEFFSRFFCMSILPSQIESQQNVGFTGINYYEFFFTPFRAPLDLWVFEVSDMLILRTRECLCRRKHSWISAQAKKKPRSDIKSQPRISPIARLTNAIKTLLA